MKLGEKAFKLRAKKMFKVKDPALLDEPQFIEAVWEEDYKTNRHNIDMNFFSQYIPLFGFRFNIDMIYGLGAKANRMYFVVCSLNPPGRLYNKNDRSFDNIKTFNKIDFGSKLGGISFREDMKQYRNVNPSESA